MFEPALPQGYPAFLFKGSKDKPEACSATRLATKSERGQVVRMSG